MTTIVDFNKIREKQKEENVQDQKDAELYSHAKQLAKYGFDMNFLMALEFFLRLPMQAMVFLTLMEYGQAMEKKVTAAKEEEGWPFVV